MTRWIAWTILVSALIACGGTASDRVATLVRAPRRFVWLTTIAGAAFIPLVLALWPTQVLVVPGGDTAVGLISGSAYTATSPWSRALAAGLLLVQRLDPWLGLVWLVASVALLVAFLRSIFALRRERSRWDEQETELCRVLVSRNAGPAVVGFWRPRVVIPAWALVADRVTRDMLLRHELEHVRAGDSRTLLGSEFLKVLFPWNAPLWWMIRMLRLAVEIDCDARVIRSGGDSREYGMMLLAVGERFTATHPLAASLTEPRLNLEARINAMTLPRPRRPIVAALSFAALGLATFTIAAAAPRPSSLVTVMVAQHTVGQATLPAMHVVASDDPSANVPLPAGATGVGAAASTGRRVESDPTNAPPELRSLRDTVDTSARINLTFQDTNIREVILAFARFSGRTIVVAKDVTGSVTVAINDQPWKSAFRSILRSQRLNLVEDPMGVITVVNRTGIGGEAHAAAVLNGDTVFLRSPNDPRVGSVLKGDTVFLRSPREAHMGSPLQGDSVSLRPPTANLAATCPLYVMDGVVLSSSCEVPTKKPDAPKCDPAVPIYIVDGVLQAAPCAKPALPDTLGFFTT